MPLDRGSCDRATALRWLAHAQFEVERTVELARAQQTAPVDILQQILDHAREHIDGGAPSLALYEIGSHLDRFVPSATLDDLRDVLVFHQRVCATDIRTVVDTEPPDTLEALRRIEGGTITRLFADVLEDHVRALAGHAAVGPRVGVRPRRRRQRARVEGDRDPLASAVATMIDPTTAE